MPITESGQKSPVDNFKENWPFGVWMELTRPAMGQTNWLSHYLIVTVVNKCYPNFLSTLPSTGPALIASRMGSPRAFSPARRRPAILPGAKTRWGRKEGRKREDWNWKEKRLTDWPPPRAKSAFLWYSKTECLCGLLLHHCGLDEDVGRVPSSSLKVHHAFLKYTQFVL